MKRVALAALTAALIAATGACANSATRNTSATPAAAASVPGATAAAVPFGRPATLTSPAGVVEVTVTEPSVEAFHAAEYDSACKVRPSDCSKPGRSADRYIVVETSWTGDAGAVDIGEAYEFEYEQPDGTLASEALPLMTFERFNALSDHNATLSPGQKTSGEIAFESSVPGGRVIVQSVAESGTSATFAAGDR